MIGRALPVPERAKRYMGNDPEGIMNTALAHAYERETEWHTRHPKLAPA
jgi:hypothetical protein